MNEDRFMSLQLFTNVCNPFKKSSERFFPPKMAADIASCFNAKPGGNLSISLVMRPPVD